MAAEDREGLKDKLSRQGEEALGRLAEELAANPLVTSALAGALEARERAVAAQEAAMGALGIPSAADIERLTRRVRSVSQRLEGIEDTLDRLDDRLGSLDDVSERLGAMADDGGPADGVERRLDELKQEVSALREQLSTRGDGGGRRTAPRSKERAARPQKSGTSSRRRPTTRRS